VTGDARADSPRDSSTSRSSRLVTGEWGEEPAPGRGADITPVQLDPRMGFVVLGLPGQADHQMRPQPLEME
jgi:hypothetical protein